MKKVLYLFVPCCILATKTIAQSPQRFNYQAIARDGAGTVLINRSIAIRFTIHDVSTTGAVLYQESHAATTNQFGTFFLAVGGGTVVTGTFASISWGVNDKYLQVELDPNGGNAYVNMGTSQLLSVPFALHAKSVATGDNWGTQTVQTSTLLSGHGTSASPLTIASPNQNNRSLRTDGSGNVTWATWGGYAVSVSGGVANASTTPWDEIDFSTSQFGKSCVSCKVLVRFYSPVSRTLYVRFPNDPNPNENVYDIPAGRSVIVGIGAQNGKFQYYSDIGGQLKYEFMGFFQ